MSNRALTIASLTGVAVAVAATAMLAYTPADKDAIADEVAKNYCASYSEDGGIKTKCKPLKRSEVQALENSGIVKKFCGTIAEQAKLCPKLYPKAKRCAMCKEGVCRFGKRGEDECDPDAKSCKPWPCNIMLGQDLESVAGETTEEKTTEVIK